MGSFCQENLDSLNRIDLNRMEFHRFDKNRDGLISRKELYDLIRATNKVHPEKPTGTPQDRFDAMDSNGDQSISPDEFEFQFVRDTIAWPAGSYKNIAYKKAGDQWLLLDMLMPVNPVFKKAPVLVFVHGGGFRSGAKEYLRLNDLRAETALQFSRNGFCCVSVNYRLVRIDPSGHDILVRDCVADTWDTLRF
jgi:acetyl esterase/lipase